MFGLVWFGLVWSSLVWFGLEWFGLVGLVFVLFWFGLVFGLVQLVWFCLVWFDLVRFRLVWFGVWFSLFCFVLFCFHSVCSVYFVFVLRAWCAVQAERQAARSARPRRQALPQLGTRNRERHSLYFIPVGFGRYHLPNMS